MFLLILILVSGFASIFPVGAAQTVRPEIRAVWVDAFHDGAKNPAQIDKLIKDCVVANLNTLIVQVRSRGEAYYNKSLEPRAEDRKLPDGFDALQYLIDKAHANRLEVHAWLNTLIAWNNRKKPPKAAGHLWNLHGRDTTGEENWLSFYRKYNAAAKSWSAKLYPSNFLDPGHPEALDYTVKIYLNIVKNYDVDGIHLDYARYDGLGWGFNPVNVARYNRCYGTTGLPLPNDPHWLQWRREQITNLVRKVYLQAIALKPQIKVSCAVITWGDSPNKTSDWKISEAYTVVGQDWHGWLQEGIIDLAMPMNYFSEWKPTHRLWYNKWIEWEKEHQYGRRIVIGVGGFLQYFEDSLKQIRRARRPSKNKNYVAGVALFAYGWNNIYSNEDYRNPAYAKKLPRQPHVYKSETNNWLFPLLSKRGYYRELARGKKIHTKPVFPESAPIPVMPWKTRPTNGYLQGTAVAPDGSGCDHLPIILEAVNSQDFKLKHPIFTDGSGWYGYAELPPGRYRVRPENRPVQETVTVIIRPGVVSEADFSIK
jgi:uncharacterized lipoprotein YddW (UPF0748 family)